MPISTYGVTLKWGTDPEKSPGLYPEQCVPGSRLRLAGLDIEINEE